ncbi:hypothetical protein, partial [uncultured Phenylobacterium sp.]|uniref:hypothetical protein n=1 Tax=uncultured Phenylobacterium sp. TaxID=349273 RepID=UPI0025CEFC17
MFSCLPWLRFACQFGADFLPTETQTVIVPTEFQVAASDWLRFTNQPGFQLGNSASLRIAGHVEVVRTAAAGGDESALGASGSAGQGLVSIEVGGRLEVTNTVTGAAAFGILSSPSGGPSIINRGAIVVTADGQASGVGNGTAGDGLVNEGYLSVTSSRSDATGVRFDGFNQRV